MPIIRRLENKLAPHETQAIQEALASARRALKNRDLNAALNDAQYLPEPQKIELLCEILATTRPIRDKTGQAHALVELASYLPELLRDKVLSKALVTAQAIRNEYDRTRALTTLATQLAELGYSEEALKTVQELPKRNKYGTSGRSPQAEALEKVVPHLQKESWLREALAMTQAIKEEIQRMPTLRVLLPRLAALGYPDEALNVMQAISDENGRADVLTALVSHLSEPLLCQALEVAQVIQNTDARACALGELAFRFVELGFPEEALAITQVIGNGHWRADVIVALAPYLSEPWRSQALEVARAIQDTDDRAHALMGLAPLVSEELQHEELDAVQERLRLKIGIPLTYHQPREIGLSNEERELVQAAFRSAKQGDPQKALSALCTITHQFRASELEKLMPHLPEELKGEALREALRAACTLQGSIITARRATVTLSNAHNRAEALAFSNASNRVEVLRDLVPHLTELPPAILYPLWREALHILAGSKRQELLQDLGELAPVIEALGGREAVEEAAQAVQDVGRWWA